MKCSRCGKNDALLLFSSTVCVNKSCVNFDKSWAKEKAKEKEQKQTNQEECQYLTSTDGNGAIYLGELDFSNLNNSFSSTFTDNNVTFYWYSNFFPYPYIIDDEY